MSKLKLGDEVILVGGEYGPFRTGDKGVVTDLQPGIFTPDIYVTVQAVGGKTATGFDWRWEKEEEGEES